MSYLQNVTYGKKFESVEIKLTFEEVRLLVYMRNRATANVSGQFTPKRYLISIFEEDWKKLNELIAPMKELL